MKEINQRDLWESQHQRRETEHENLENIPNNFAAECIKLIPKNGTILEIGSANGRDARYFAKEKGIKVFALDFSKKAIEQLCQAAEKDGASSLVFPVMAETQHLPLAKSVSLDAIYARSSLHLSDEELEIFMDSVAKMLKSGGHLMVEGKPKSDFKISRSEEISPNLFRDQDGHIRRAWDGETIKKLCDKFGLQLISSEESEEVWENKKAKFVNFVIQKYE